tara:strand:- start:30626 stop:31372 length:747 start_codon:yes stop_codon:yes gene_type:complete
MRQSLLAICLGLFLLSSCQEKDLLVDNPPPPADNLFWSFVPYYGEEGLDYDSIYTNDLGIQFMIDSISLLITDVNFYDENLKQVIDTAPNFIHFTRGDNEKLSGLLPAGGYYGNYNIFLGGDSLNSVKYRSEISRIAPKMVRKDGFGLDFFKVQGRIFDPTKMPTDSIFLPIEYTVGSYLLADTMNTDRRSFSIDNDQQITIVLISDLKPVLSGINFNLIQDIISDPTDVQDFTLAKQLKDSLEIGIF